MHARTTLLVACSLVIVGCRSSPTSPRNGGALPFRSGAYMIDFAGDSIACGDVKNPQAGTAVSVRMDMQVTSDRASATATSSRGGLTLRLQPDHVATVFGLRLTGMADGAADDEGGAAGGITIPANGTRMTIDPRVVVTGEVPSPTVTDFAFGTVDGTVVFSRGGVASTCPSGAVRWTLNRLP